MLRLGSLFSGSGGFELAGAMFGIEPVWAAEVDPYPIKVTTNRFPNMKHLGSVTDINGADIEPVDIITFGSPCQDLSVAGKQAGIHDGERSSLFFEAIRIIKEMRNATANRFPRFIVFENVPGIFSSNNGRDFHAALQSFVSTVDENVSVPGPENWSWQPAGVILGDMYSFAWRVLDAQYFGVAQRRRRLFLVGDLAGGRAGEILFESNGMPWHPPTGRSAEKNASAYVKGSTDGSSWFKWCK